MPVLLSSRNFSFVNFTWFKIETDDFLILLCFCAALTWSIKITESGVPVILTCVSTGDIHPFPRYVSFWNLQDSCEGVHVLLPCSGKWIQRHSLWVSHLKEFNISFKSFFSFLFVMLRIVALCFENVQIITGSMLLMFSTLSGTWPLNQSLGSSRSTVSM